MSAGASYNDELRLVFFRKVSGVAQMYNVALNVRLTSGQQMSIFKHKLCLLSASLTIALAIISPVCAADDWQPVRPEELQMTSEAKAPGAPAIFLYRKVDRNDEESKEHNYARIKILTEQGLKYANVEIPFLKDFTIVNDIHARTIQPDGSIADFNGTIYEKTIVKAKGIKVLVKTIALPDVRVGTIVEYQYSIDTSRLGLRNTRWILSSELFTKRADFSLRRTKRFSILWSYPKGLPEGTTPPHEDNGVVTMAAQNVPAFQVEDYMPPQDEMKYRVDFRYTNDFETDPDKFWAREDKRVYASIDLLIDKPKVMEKALSEIVSPSDTPEIKLQKIYARTQKVHNTTYERRVTSQERKRAATKPSENLEEVWKNNLGTSLQINWLFLALARAAGFEASPVWLSTRDLHLFNPKFLNAADLNAYVILVQLNGHEIYLNPGNTFAPYGLLPWSETGVRGLRLDSDGGKWITTPLPEPSQSKIERKATLHLTDSGSLEGTATFTYTGLEALWRRFDERNADDLERKKFLEDQIREYVRVPIVAELTNQPDWDNNASSFVAEYKLKISDWTSPAGHRYLFPLGLFGASEKNVFEHTARVNPIYFNFPYLNTDQITVELPFGWTVTSLPKEQKFEYTICGFTTNAESANGSLHLQRQLRLDIQMLDARYYPAVRDFFQSVRTADDQQIVLTPAAASSQN
jgi:hypothetical protein